MGKTNFWFRFLYCFVAILFAVVEFRCYPSLSIKTNHFQLHESAVVTHLMKLRNHSTLGVGWPSVAHLRLSSVVISSSAAAVAAASASSSLSCLDCCLCTVASPNPVCSHAHKQCSAFFAQTISKISVFLCGRYSRALAYQTPITRTLHGHVHSQTPTVLQHF